MNSISFAAAVLALNLVSPIGLATAQNAPGEDPVVLSKRVAIQMLPVGGSRGSEQIYLPTDMPASIKAKVARYEAKAKSERSEGILNDADVNQTATSDGFKRTCIQDIGSNTVSASAGGAKIAPGNQQIVVLKGDLVNICK